MKILFFLIIISAFSLTDKNAKADYCYTYGQGNSADSANGTTQMNSRTISETNAMAGTLCVLMQFLTSDITKAVLAFVLVIMGFGAYMGKLNIGLIVSYVIGVGLMFAVPIVFNLMAPYSNVGAGCKCKRFVVVGYNATGANPGPPGYGALPNNGSPGYVWQDLALNPDCTLNSSYAVLSNC